MRGKIMIFDKKDETCGKIRDKLKFIHTVLDAQKLVEEYYSKRSKVKVKETISTDNETYYCTPVIEPSLSYFEAKAYERYCKGKYFTNKNKDIIIDYLLDCLVNDEAFDYSTLGPNIYKNEHSISNVSDTQL